jgi:nitrogen fixation protein NifU and related proteins
MELNDLYQELILDHNARPHHFGELKDANHQADGINPLCGDQLKVMLHLDNQGVINDVAFIGTGCAISKASASIMTDAVKGKTTQEVEQLFTAFHEMVTGDGSVQAPGKLQAFAGVREFPVRVKCATLCWHTLRAALHDEHSVTTE